MAERIINIASKFSREFLLEQGISTNLLETPLKLFIQEKKRNGAEMHTNVNDLFYLLSGSLEFICNGKLIDPQKVPDDPNTFIADEIEGGKTFLLKPGDWLFVPSNCPHQRINLEKSSFLVIKIPNKN